MKNTMIKVLSLVIALTMIVATLGTVTVFAADECNHTKGALIETKAPTCQTPGFSRYTCGACGEEWVTDVIQASDEYHNIEEVDAVAASCLTPGYTAGKRCTVAGCDEIFEGVRPTGEAQKPHVFVGTEYLPTCTDNGKVVYTCSLCGKTAKWLKDNNKLLPAQLAEYTEKWAEKATDKTASGHNYEWVIKTAPVNTNGTCTDGLSEGVCANCGDKKTAVLPVSHNWVKINPSNLPCVEWNANAEWCSNCKTIKPGDENKKQQTTGHNADVPYEGKLNPADPAFLAYGFKLQDLYDLGFELNDDLKVEATCTTDGSQLVKCSCGLLYVKTLPKTNHRWGAWSDYSIPTLCTEDSVKTRECSVCDAEEKSVYAAATKTAHATKVEVTAPHCLTMGYTTTTCTNTWVIGGKTYTCGHNVVSDWKDPAGHTYGPVTLKSGSCDNGEWVKTCTREGCKATDEGHEIAGTPTNAQKTHSWGAEVKVAGTCHEKSYKYKQCTKCNYYYADADTVSATLVKLRTDDDKVDATNHEYVHVRWAAATPTCATASAVEVVECKWCDVDDNTQITRTVNNPVEHTIETGYVTVSGSTKTFHAGDKAATCQTTGFKADGKACSVCCYVEKAPTATEKNPANHADAPDADNKVGSYVAATCQADGYQKHYLTCCGEVIVKSTTDTKKDTCSWVAGTAGNALVPATCTTNGSHRYQKCQWCGTIKPESVDVTGCTACTDAKHEAAKFNNDPVIKMLGHDYSVNVARTASVLGTDNNSTCDDTFIKAHKKCSRCNYVQLNGVEYKSASEAAFLAVARELPHYEAYKQTFTAVTATCKTNGVDGSKAYCTVCEKDEWIIPASSVAHTMTNEFRINYVNTAAEGSTAVWAIENCTKDACVVTECSVCGYKTTNYTKAADANHRWSSETTYTPTLTCKEDTVKTKYCLDCATATTTVVTTVATKATGCYTTKGVTGTNAQKFFISYDCDKIAEFIGWTCDVCHDTVDITDVAHNIVNYGTIGYNVKLEDVLANLEEGEEAGYVVEPTCTADGYKVIYCVGCGLTKAADAVNYVDPIYETLQPSGALLENAPAVDYKHDEVNGIILETTADFVKYICADCGETITRVIEKPAPTLTKTFAVSANKVAAGDTIKVTYTFAGVAGKVENTTVLVEYDTDLFTLVGVETNLEGLYAVSSVVYNGANVALIVEPKADGTAREIATTADGTVVFTVTLKANKTAYGEETVAGKDVKILAVGDLNGSGFVSADDAQALFQYVGTNNAAADVNLDGIVNLADVIALAKFAASEKTAADYFEMVGELDKLEDEVFALLDANKINDLNGDRVTNISDAYYLIAALNMALVEMDYDELGEFNDATTMAELVAYVNTYYGLFQ